MLPEIETLTSAVDAIKDEVNKAYEAYRHDTGLSDEEYYKRRETYVNLRDGRYARIKELVDKLAETTNDKLVKFIAEECYDEYDTQALRVLQRLPATLDELDDFAKEQGWCGVWDDSVDKAIEAGALDVDEATRAKRRVRRYLRNEMYENEANRVMELLEEYVNARVEAAVANLAKTANVVVDALTK